MPFIESSINHTCKNGQSFVAFLCLIQLGANVVTQENIKYLSDIDISCSTTNHWLTFTAPLIFRLKRQNVIIAFKTLLSSLILDFAAGTAIWFSISMTWLARLYLNTTYCTSIDNWTSEYIVWLPNTKCNETCIKRPLDFAVSQDRRSCTAEE